VIITGPSSQDDVVLLLLLFPAVTASAVEDPNTVLVMLVISVVRVRLLRVVVVVDVVSAVSKTVSTSDVGTVIIRISVPVTSSSHVLVEVVGDGNVMGKSEAGREMVNVVFEVEDAATEVRLNSPEVDILTASAVEEATKLEVSLHVLAVVVPTASAVEEATRAEVLVAPVS
jgi:hypothetical protein